MIKTHYNSQVFYGMMNIGVNPTVDGKERSIEMNLFEFSEDIYGESFEIQLIERLREEKKFSSLMDLKAQLEKDKKSSQAIIKKLRSLKP